MTWFFPTFWTWYGFSVPLVSYYRIAMALESRAAPRSLALIRFFHGLWFFLQKEVVESIGNPAGIGQGTGLGLRERERDGIGLGLSRLRASKRI